MRLVAVCVFQFIGLENERHLSYNGSAVCCGGLGNLGLRRCLLFFLSSTSATFAMSKRKQKEVSNSPEN